MRTIRAVDMFCGAGGSSSGLQQACDELGYRLDLTAINHWQVAVETHAANHPGARHLCESMENLDPRKVWGGRGRLDLLWGSPECTHHSVARGGRPINDQSRASAWHVVRWAEALRPRIVCVENVPEFSTWGPIGHAGRPIARLRGEVFLAWRRALEALGYRVEHRVLNAADYGEATTRRRLFVQAVLRGSPRWPEPTHAPEARSGFVGSAARWRPSRDVIDWTIQGRSIFGRGRPLAPKTMARIEAGIRRFWGAAAEPFITKAYGTGTAASIGEPLPTATTKDRFGLVESAGLDIRFRMLQPHELAAAMGFPSDYRFAGTKGDAVRQIGNAVSVRTARAICMEALA